jgi:uncharacterized protein
MRSTKKGDVHIVLVERGEKVIEKLTLYCKQQGISAGYLTAIGAVEEAEIAHYTVDSKEYSTTILKEPMEIANLTGNVSSIDGEPYLHCHITLGKKDFSVVCGHLKEAKVHAVCEVYIFPVELHLERRKDEGIGLNVWKM